MLPLDIAGSLWALTGLDPTALASLSLVGSEPVLPSSFRVDAAAQASIGAAGLAAAEVWRCRTGVGQGVSVDIRHAAVEFRSERHVRVAGETPREAWDAIAGAYRCGDGRWVRLHTNFPHHRAGVLRLLGCEGTREAVAASLQAWPAEVFETAATEAGMCVAAMRSFAEWDAHPHGRTPADTAALVIERIGDAKPVSFRGEPVRPLSGVRVLELTRVIAGPVAGRTLAAHGAEVLHVTGPGVPNLPGLIRDTGRGKRAAVLDLRDAGGRAAMRELIAGADVFLQSYRAGALAAHGFSPAAVAALRPGIVVASLSAYGEVGPWGGKRGFDSLVQTATGFNEAEGRAAGEDGPRALPCQALDHASGYLLALGVMAALLRREAEGGSWLVRVSLAGTGRWLRGLGRLAEGLAVAEPANADEFTEVSGGVTAVRHAARLAATPAFWAHPAHELGSDRVAWEG